MNQDILKSYPDNHFDSIVTDPPYGIEFLGKDWDSNTGAVETWQECYRVLKPGGHILAFSAARTYHNLATNIESVGFEIRDQLMWLYSSGFPKAQDIGKAIERREGKRDTGNGFDSEAYTGTFAESTGNERAGGIGACSQCGKNNMAFPKNYNKCEQEPCFMREQARAPDNKWAGWKTALKPAHEPIVMARKPFKGSAIDNVQKHGTGALNIDATRIGDEVREIKDIVPIRETSQFAGKANNGKDGNGFNYKPLGDKTYVGRYPSNVLGEIPDYQKYFYCPKVSRAERHIGFEVGNNHPTVKPVELMSYLVKLVTPEGGKVLDPFNGSGSTGMACVEHGFEYTGCELDPDYVAIATKRIEGWFAKTRPDTNFNELFD